MVGTTTSNRSWEVWQTLRGWDLLDRFSSVSFMAVRPKEAGTLGLGLDDSQARSLHTLIRALKGVRVYDFEYLLVSSRKTVHSKLCRA